MTRILALLSVDFLDNNHNVILSHPFGFISDVLIKHGLRQVGWESRPLGYEDEFWLPQGFVFDFESTPNLIRGPLGENKRGGAAHDGVCRKNVLVCWNGVCEGITKSIAADVYFEIMAYCDIINFKLADHYTVTKPVFLLRDWTRRWAKSTVVRVWPGDFFQRYYINATAEEIYGIKCDPYVTVEKLDEAIVQSKEATAAIKAVPEVDQKADLVAASEQVTADLKDAKKEANQKL